MDPYIISEDKKTFITTHGQITFQDEIANVLTLSNVWVVHLENIEYKNGQPSWNMTKQPSNNIYGVDKYCKIIWNIGQIIVNPSDDHYSIPKKLSDNTFTTTGFWGFTYAIDIPTLSVVDTKWTK